jgi:hypothetical protein
MNLEALLVIGAVSIAITLVLYAGGRLIARWYKSKHPQTMGSMRVTRTGFVLFGFLVLAWVIGAGWVVLRPDDGFGQFLSHGLGFVSYVFGVSLCSMPFAWWLEKKGFGILARKNDGA